MLEALESMTFELRQTLLFCSDCFGNVATLLRIIEENLDVGQPVPPEYSFILTIAALRAKLPVYELDQWIKKWDQILSDDYMKVVGKLHHGEDLQNHTDFIKQFRSYNQLQLRYSYILAGFSEEVKESSVLTSKYKEDLKGIEKLALEYSKKAKRGKSITG